RAGRSDVWVKVRAPTARPQTRAGVEMDDKKLLDTVNRSGFPLQIGLEKYIRETEGRHGWKVVFREHSWRNGDASGFIDLVLENAYGTGTLVLECKRINDWSWTFLNPIDQIVRAKCWVSYQRNRGHVIHDWFDLEVLTSTPESEFCVVDGQDPKSRPML